MKSKTLKQIICLIAFSVLFASCNNFNLKLSDVKPLPALDTNQAMYIFFDQKHEMPENAQYIGNFVLEHYGQNSIMNGGNKSFLQIIKLFDDKILSQGANCLYVNATPYKNERSLYEGKMYLIPEFDNYPYTEKDLVDKWTNSKMDSVEGIYEKSMEEFGFKYFSDKFIRYAIVRKDSTSYVMVYLNGLEILPYNVGLLKVKKMWKEGDVISYLEKTNSPSVFKCKTYDFNKSLTKNCMLKYDEGNLRIYKKTDIDWYRKIFPFSAKKESFVSSLTGFSLNSNEILTCYHGVKDTSLFYYIRGVNGDFDKKYLAKLKSYDKELDLAIVKLIDTNQKINNILSINTESKNTADEIFVLGYPYSTLMGEEIKLTNGIINSTSGFTGNVDSYQFSASIQPGNSGSPLFDKKGNLIGVVNAGIPAASNVGYALKISKVLDFFKSNQINWNGKEVNSLEKYSLSEQLKMIKNNIYLIETFETEEKAKERAKLIWQQKLKKITIYYIDN